MVEVGVYLWSISSLLDPKNADAGATRVDATTRATRQLGKYKGDKKRES